MTEHEAPPAHPTPQPPSQGPIEQVASGQKMIIYAILINIVTYVLQIAIHPLLGLLAIAAIALGIIGIINLAKGLGKSTGMTVLFVILMFVPCVSIIMLLILNSEATKELERAGYRVGLMGASKR
ncbi:MAG: hypothetical protein AAGA29_02485 [Planctomycetota bacterium]